MKVRAESQNKLPGSEQAEVRMLLNCARTFVDEQSAHRIRTLSKKGLNWDRIVYLAVGHGLVPLLYKNLNAICPTDVPEVYLERLRNESNKTPRRNALLTRELLSLLELLEANDISAMPYKGPALARQVYRDVGLRGFVDLDLLIRRRDLAKVRELIVAHGYEPKIKMTAAKEKAIFRSECDEVFTGHEGKIILEVHWAITPPFFSFGLQTDELFERATRIDLLGKPVLAPEPEDLLLILCVNGAKDMWTRLELICCVAELIRGNPKIDWRRATEQARRFGAERMLLLGLLLAHDLFGASLPTEVFRTVERSSKLRSMAGQVSKRLFLNPEERPSLFALTLFRLRSRERLRDRVNYCIKRATAPTYKDVESLRLPASLEFLYPLLRPLRLIRRSDHQKHA